MFTQQNLNKLKKDSIKLLQEILFYLNKTSIKITVFIAFIFLFLFLLLDLVVIRNSRDSFVRTIQGIEVPKQAQSAPINSTQPYSIFYFDKQTGQIRVQPLRDKFTDDFQKSIAAVLLIGLVLIVFVGFVSSRIVVAPLQRLLAGINNLKQNNYKFKIEKTGTSEFDIVIDEFNRLTSELNRIEELRKDLISDTSHELKTPLTSLKGQLEAVKVGVLEMDADRAKLLIEQVERLDNLVESLQEFSRLRNKSFQLNISKINLLSLVNSLKELKKDDLEQNKLEIELNIDQSLEIEADREKLQRVFENLLTNAIKYSKGTKIFISANDKEIIFKDNGVGIGEEHLPYIFERFYRVEKSRNRKTGGLGLGLSILKEIIESHKWEIEVKSPPEDLETGTEFRIKIK
jgi:signal transduction histidine kinase